MSICGVIVSSGVGLESRDSIRGVGASHGVVLESRDSICSVVSPGGISNQSIDTITRIARSTSRTYLSRCCRYPTRETSCITREHFASSWCPSGDLHLSYYFELGSWSSCSDTDISPGGIDRDSGVWRV